MPISFLLAMQASGMVVDWLGANEQVRLGKMGNQVEQAGINAQIQTSRLQTEDDSLQSMKQLRQNLGTQAAMLAARGVSPGPTSAIMANESVGNFNADQRMRKINQTGREAALKANSVISTLHKTTNQNDIWNSFRNRAFNNFPTSPAAWSAMSNYYTGNKSNSGVATLGT